MVYAGPQMLQQIENLNPQIRLGFFFLPGKNGTVYAMDDRSVQWGISSLTARDGKRWMRVPGSFSLLFRRRI